jgi:hypothetical protein
VTAATTRPPGGRQRDIVRRSAASAALNVTTARPRVRLLKFEAYTAWKAPALSAHGLIAAGTRPAGQLRPFDSRTVYPDTRQSNMGRSEWLADSNGGGRHTFFLQMTTPRNCG